MWSYYLLRLERETMSAPLALLSTLLPTRNCAESVEPIESPTKTDPPSPSTSVLLSRFTEACHRLGVLLSSSHSASSINAILSSLSCVNGDDSPAHEAASAGPSSLPPSIVSATVEVVAWARWILSQHDFGTLSDTLPLPFTFPENVQKTDRDLPPATAVVKNDVDVAEVLAMCPDGKALRVLVLKGHPLDVGCLYNSTSAMASVLRQRWASNSDVYFDPECRHPLVQFQDYISMEPLPAHVLNQCPASRPFIGDVRSFKATLERRYVFLAPLILLCV